MNRDLVSGKIHRMRSLWAILLILLFPAHCLAGEGKPIKIMVTADHTKADGKPWDGIPGRISRSASFVWICLRNAA
jgi:hypothetical protein